MASTLVFEADSQESSFGFRPRRSPHDANNVIRQTVNRGYNLVVDADIQSYFDNSDHGQLMGMAPRRISNRRVLRLIKRFLRAGVLEEREIRKTTTGTKQGGVLSPLLASIYLNYLGQVWAQHCRSVGLLVRYADDLVVFCQDKEAAQEALRRLGLVINRLALRSHPTKTRLADLQEGKQGFDFLGFHHRQVRSRRTGR